MEANVTVERLWMDNKMHRRGDTLGISEERITQLGTSVKRVVPTIAQIDERDVEIVALKEKVEELENALADAVSKSASPSAGKTPAKNRGSR